MLKLHLGCGGRILEGWVNVDWNTIAERNVKLGHEEIVARDIDLRHDLTQPLPYAPDTVDYIYNEHLIEHFSFMDGRKMLRDWLRVLKPGGVLRLATPPVEEAIALYADPERFDRLNVQMGRNVQTRGVFLNQLFRSFGHRFVYDEPTLRKQLVEVGYGEIVSRPVSESDCEPLCGLETRFYGVNSFLTSLCMEAAKPTPP